MINKILRKKQGSALLVTLVVLVFLMSLMVSINFNTQIRYWLSRNDQDEFISFYNAYSALILAEAKVKSLLEEGQPLPELWQEEENLNGERIQALIFEEGNNIILEGRGGKKETHSLFKEQLELTGHISKYPLLLAEKISNSLIIKVNNLASNFVFLLPKENSCRFINNSKRQCLAIEQLKFGNIEQSFLNLDNIEAFNLITETDIKYPLLGLVFMKVTPGEYNIERFDCVDVVYCDGNLKIVINQNDEAKLPCFHINGKLELDSCKDVKTAGFIICKQLEGDTFTLFLNPNELLLDILIQNEAKLLPPSSLILEQVIAWINSLYYIPEIIN